MEGEELEGMFRDLEKESTNNSTSVAEMIIKGVEAKFRGTPEQVSREEEREEIRNEIKSYTSQLHKYKNIRNPRATIANQKRKEMRDKLRKKIELCKLRLKEIDMEEEK